MNVFIFIMEIPIPGKMVFYWNRAHFIVFSSLNGRLQYLQHQHTVDTEALHKPSICFSDLISPVSIQPTDGQQKIDNSPAKFFSKQAQLVNIP